LEWGRAKRDRRLPACPATAASTALKKDGWAFVGPTTVYAFMQSMGLVNDHVDGCVIRAKCEKARKAFKRPGDLRGIDAFDESADFSHIQFLAPDSHRLRPIREPIGNEHARD
jgi:hypothetical protein